MEAVIAGTGCTDDQKIKGTAWQIGEATDFLQRALKKAH
jgi:hypothetical protein